MRDFPGGPGVRNLPVNAGEAGSIPDQRSHMPWGQLNPQPQLESPSAATIEPRPSGARGLKLERNLPYKEDLAHHS